MPFGGVTVNIVVSDGERAVPSMLFGNVTVNEALNTLHSVHITRY